MGERVFLIFSVIFGVTFEVLCCCIRSICCEFIRFFDSCLFCDFIVIVYMVVWCVGVLFKIWWCWEVFESWMYFCVRGERIFIYFCNFFVGFFWYVMFNFWSIILVNYWWWLFLGEICRIYIVFEDLYFVDVINWNRFDFYVYFKGDGID